MLAIKHALGQFELEPEVVRVETMPRRPIALVFLPLKDTGRHMVTTASALLLLHDEQAEWSPDLTPLQAFFQLTDAELELSSALCRGLTLTEFAQQQNKSRETLRTQLRRVFSKVGAANQTDLVVTLLSHPALLVQAPLE
jgi:DNA-binding CsgD family transcriptional regulator